MSGRLIAVVGPSGVGKDSVMAGIAAAMPDVKLVQRTITRAPDLGSEVYDACTPEAFAKIASEGTFCLHWRAHGSQYGIPVQVLADVRAGVQFLANLSRGALRDAAEVFPALTVLHITATSATLAGRLGARGRETPDQIEMRLAQAGKPLPEGMAVIAISNDGALDETVAHAVRALQLARV